MDTQVKTPSTIFHLPQHLLVPLYQRRYVWEEETQWEPLWEDVLRLAELRQAGQYTARHFLGAVVVQDQPQGMGGVQTYDVVDGQQRLTTLQLLLDAARSEFRLPQLETRANRLAALTRNDPAQGFEGVEQLKIVHKNDDGEPFQRVMLEESDDEESSIGEDQQGELIERAHRYFSKQVRLWLTDEGPDQIPARAQTLVDILTDGLELVVITLRHDEDSQAIFETLNARGTPLTQSDLIKNFIFQRLKDEGEDLESIYQQTWRDFEQQFWARKVRTGQHQLPRIAVFLNHWLTARTGEQVRIPATFRRFTHWFTYENNRTMRAVVNIIRSQATQYREWMESAELRDGELDVPSLFVYRTQAARVQTVWPILLFVYDPGRGIEPNVAGQAVRHVESWALRRSLLRRPTASMSQTVAGLIRELHHADREHIAERTQAYLRRSTHMSTYWPADEELRQELQDMSAYSAHTQRRLRMFLEAVEDDARGYVPPGTSRTGSRVSRDRMHIEHVLPRRWNMNWPVESLTEQIERDAHVHRFGNLTLLTQSLNSAVSNGPWAGPGGKRASLQQHDVLLMNRPLRDSLEWNEEAINSRTAQIAEALIRTWPTPEGHTVDLTVTKPASEDDYVHFREIVAAGLIAPGDTLYFQTDRNVTATVTKDGKFDVGGQTFDTPYGALKAAGMKGTHSWSLWRLKDGRRLTEVRDEFRRLRTEAENSEPVGCIEAEVRSAVEG